MKPIRTFAAAAILATLTACASHGGDAARQPDSRQSSAMNQTHTAVSKYSFDDTVRRLETAVKEKGMTVVVAAVVATGVLAASLTACNNGTDTTQPATTGAVEDDQNAELRELYLSLIHISEPTRPY